MTLMDQNDIHNEIKIRLNSGNFCYLLKWLYSPMWTFASLMDFSQSSLIDLTVPRPHLRLSFSPKSFAFPSHNKKTKD